MVLTKRMFDDDEMVLGNWMASMCKICAPRHCGRRQCDAGGNGHAAAALLLRACSRSLQALAATIPNAALLRFLFSLAQAEGLT